MEPIKKKKSKIDKNSKEKNKDDLVNGKPEVFVIPPNLLEKLGINLGTIKSGEIAINANINFKEFVGNDNELEKPSTSDNNSSIIETANLMKAAVFCSPTFTANATNGITEENYIQENIPVIDNLEQYASGSITSDYLKTNINNQNTDVLETTPINQVLKSPNTQIPDLPLAPSEQVYAVNEMNEVPKESIPNGTYNIDDHSDEAYLSDCSNSNSDLSVPKANYDTLNKATTVCNGITIISEQILNTTHIQQIKNSRSGNNEDFTPVLGNSMITTDFKNVLVNKSETISDTCNNTQDMSNFDTHVTENKNQPIEVLYKDKCIEEINEEVCQISENNKTGEKSNNYLLSAQNNISKADIQSDSKTNIHEDSIERDNNINPSSNIHHSQNLETKTILNIDELHNESIESCYKSNPIKLIETNIKEPEMNKTSKETNTRDSETNKTSKETNTRNSETNKTSKETNTRDSKKKKKSKERNTRESVTNKTSKETNTGESETNKSSKETNTRDSEKNKTSKEINTKESGTNKIPKERNTRDSKTNKTSKEANTGDSETNKTSKETNTRKSKTNTNSKERNTRESVTNKTSKDTITGDSETNKTSKVTNIRDSKTNKTPKESNTRKSKTNKTSKETNTKDSEMDQISKETNTGDSETNKTSKETNTRDSKTNKNSKETNTRESVTNKTSKETNTRDSKTNKTSKGKYAKDSETNKTSRETNTKDSETNKTSKEANTGDSETNKTSEEPNTGESETNKTSIETNIGDTETNKTSEYTEDDTQEKVKEIAEYLNQINEKRKMLKQNKGLIKQKSNTVKSKLPTHGVEKPGGDEKNLEDLQCNTPLKTYKPSSKTKKQIPKLTSQLNITNNVDLISLPKSDTDISKQYFCTCLDFGKLEFYEADNLYEHLHFLERRDIDCDLETIFSIYYESNLANDVITELTVDDTKTIEDIDGVFIKNTLGCCNTDIVFNDLEEVNYSNIINLSEDIVLIKEIKREKDKSKSRKSSTDPNLKTGIIKETTKTTKDKINNHVQSENSSIAKIEKKISGSTPKSTDSSTEQPNGRIVSNKNKRKLDADKTNINQNKNDRENLELVNKHSASKMISKIEGGIEKSSIKARIASMTKTDSTINATNRNNTIKVVRTYEKSKNANNNNPEEKTAKTVSKNHRDSLIVEIDLSKSQPLSNAEVPAKVSQKANEKTPPKRLKVGSERRISIEVPLETSACDTITDEQRVTCGVCKKQIEDSLWLEHITKKHNYLAWKDTEPAVNLKSEESVRQHLQNISHQNGGLVCSNCGLVRKNVKTYLNHINNCNNSESPEENLSSPTINNTQEKTQESEPIASGKTKKRKREKVETKVTCGVCQLSVKDSDWMEHIKNEHDYIAWHTGEPPLNTNDENEVKSHLNTVSKYSGGLVCKKCGLLRKYVKHYLDHIQTCDGTRPDQSMEDSILDKTFDSPIVVCGVCKESVARKGWIEHMTKQHHYLAWIEGESPPLDVTVEDDVYHHMCRTVKLTGELICHQCGITRRYAKSYLQHLKECTGDGVGNDYCQQIKVEVSIKSDEYICGICNEKGERKHWRQHAMNKHYNIAWRLGEEPINYRNTYRVLRFLKEYNIRNKLVCKVCGITRVSHFGFYAHILTCGKTDKELEPLHDTCNICQNKYLCIYKSQHMTMHKEKEMKLERKELQAAKAEERRLQELEITQGGRRKAAEKAKKEIKNFAGENANKDEDSDDSEADVTVKIEPQSEHESTDDEILLSDASNEEDLDSSAQKKKKLSYESVASKVVRIPFKVPCYKLYLKKSYEDFCKLHMSTENLFDSYRNKRIEVVSDAEATQYLPSLTESCRVKLVSGDWTTLKRFDAKYINGTCTMFSGGAARGALWAPARGDDESHVLALTTHGAGDLPRYDVNQLYTHRGLIQLWNFHDFISTPKFQLGIIHDYGTIWAFDWCPSGARDLLPESIDVDNNAYRLGLLAIACSNGLAYVLSVPYPSDEEKVQYCRLKPIVELRLSMSSERKLYQATSLFWCNQKGHEVIIVGYADGTTAFYDLNTESPFLKTTENEVTILYPFQDRKPENAPITGVCGQASASSVWGSGVCAGGAGGAGVWRAGARGATLQLPAHALRPAPHWPAAMLLSDVALSLNSPNEVEWMTVGGGRRVGGASAAAGCARCAVCALSAPPALRLMRAHPCYPEIKKQNIAMLRMIPLGQKRKHPQTNDDLSMVIQPLTYEDAIVKYGLELTLIAKSDPASSKYCAENDQYPERFPLSDVCAMSFCPSDRYHGKLAVATHAGLIFIVNTS